MNEEFRQGNPAEHDQQHVQYAFSFSNSFTSTCPVIVIWDGVNPHRSVVTRQFVEQHAHRLTLIRLPAYGPERNPVDGARSWYGRTVVGNFCSEGQVVAGPRLFDHSGCLRSTLRQRFATASALSLPVDRSSRS